MREIRTLGAMRRGAGNGLTVRIMRHSQGKLGANKLGRTYGAPRQSSTLPQGKLVMSRCPTAAENG